MTGQFITRCSWLSAAFLALSCVVAIAQGPTFNLGSPPARHQLLPPDAAVGPEGKDLPEGSGTAKEGAMVYIARGCARCHGSNGSGGPGPTLLGQPGRNIGIASSPFAPLIWSYINQMMPLDMQVQFATLRQFSSLEWAATPAQCCLSPDEVYSLTAFLLFRSGIIAEDRVMNAETLPKVQMPNRDSYVPPPYLKSPWKPGMRHAENKQ